MYKIGVFNDKKVLIDVARSSSDRAKALQNLLGIDFNFNVKDLVEVKVDKKQLTYKLLNLLNLREEVGDLAPDFKGRFEEKDVLEIVDFQGKKLILYNSGYDNTILFLVNIYNELKEYDRLYLLFAKNFKEIREFANCDLN